MTLSFYFPALRRVAFERLPKGNGEAEIPACAVYCREWLFVLPPQYNNTTFICKSLHTFTETIKCIFLSNSKPCFHFLFLSQRSWLVSTLPKNNFRLALLWSTKIFMSNSIIRKRQESSVHSSVFPSKLLSDWRPMLCGTSVDCFRVAWVKLTLPGSQQVLIPCENSHSPCPAQ